MAKSKPKLSIEQSKYAENLRQLMAILVDAYKARERVDEVQWSVLRNHWNEYLEARGARKTDLHMKSLQRFHDESVAGQLDPYTLLRLGVIAQHLQPWMPKRDRTWGKTFQDALDRVCDQLVYGAPAQGEPDRWQKLGFDADRIAAEYNLATSDGPSITGLLNALANLTNEELRQLIDNAAGQLQTRAESVEQLPMEDPRPCDENCPLALIIAARKPLQMPISPEDVEAMAADARMPTDRMQRLLCGDVPTMDEIHQIAGALRMPYEGLKDYLIGTGVIDHYNVNRPG